MALMNARHTFAGSIGRLGVPDGIIVIAIARQRREGRPTLVESAGLHWTRGRPA